MKRYMPATKRKAGASRPKPTKRRKMASRPNTTLGRITGKIAPSRTTMARTVGPFSNKKFVTFLYENELTSSGATGALTTLSTACNSLYDYDKTTGAIFGNKQPLYYDNLLSSSGPYKIYKVISWKTTYTIVNVSGVVPVTVWAIPPVNAANEVDSAAEADNMPGVKRIYLTNQYGNKSSGTITVTGHYKDVYPASETTGGQLGGVYNTDPQDIIYGGLIIHAADGTTTPTVYVAVRHEAYAELEAVDALVS